MIGCKKEDGLSLEKVKYNNNKISYPKVQMDSTQAINAITRQKIQEVLDLSILYNSSNKDTEIDSTMYTQLLGYFHKADSNTLKPLLNELSAYNVKNAKIRNLSVYEKKYDKDTLNFAKFNVDYFGDNNKSIGSKVREAQYILISSPVKFKQEFKFYFINFYRTPPKDSVSVGVIK